MTSGVLAQNKLVLIKTDRFRRHDLVGRLFHDHAMLMNAGLVGKGIRPDNGLVGLHHDAGDSRQHAAGGIDVLGGHARVVGQYVIAGPKGHDQFFEGAVAGTLTDTVDGAFHLACASLHGRQRVGHRKTEIIVAVHRDRRLVDIGHIVAQIGNDLKKFRWNGIADRIGDIDDSRTGVNDRLNHLCQKWKPGAYRILSRKFDIVGIFLGSLDGFDRSGQDLILIHLQLVLHMDIGSRDEGVDTAALLGVLQRFPGTVDVFVVGTAETCDLRTLDRLRDFFDSFKITIGSNREARFDDVDIQTLELVGNPELLFNIHAGARRLFSVTQGCIENFDHFIFTHAYLLCSASLPP